ncbi:hypothetical protein JCM10212_002030 [Sporobolomyces blumeae]
MQSLLLKRAFSREAASRPPTPLPSRPPSPPPSDSPSARRSSDSTLHEGIDDCDPRQLARGGAGAIDGDKELQKPPADPDADPFLVEFAPNDPQNPRNWSYLRRWLITFQIAHIALLVGAAGSINSAAVHQAADALGVSVEVALLDTAVFLIGFGISAPLMGPLSELGGRNPVYILTILIFIVFEVGCAVSTNIQTRVVLRFFAGCFGASPLTNAGGSLADLWSPDERTFAFPVFAVAGFFGPAVGPVMGGWIGQTWHYEWCDWVSAIWGALVFIICLVLMPETFAPTILALKAKHLRRKTGDSRFSTSLERLRASVPFRAHLVEALKRPFKMLFLEPIVALFSCYMSIVYLILFGDLVSYEYIYEPYHLSTGELGLAFLPICVGLLLCGLTIPFMTREYRKTTRRCQEQGIEVEPEERLKVAMIGSWAVPISLFWGAWTCYESVSIWAVFGSQVLFGFGILTCFISSYQYTIDAYLSTAASALSALTLVRYPVSGGSVLFMGPMYERLGRHWALTLLAFLSLAASFIPWLFYFYGKRIRSWSRYAPTL